MVNIELMLSAVWAHVKCLLVLKEATEGMGLTGSGAVIIPTTD
jgi:hypothetical protein